MNAVRTPPRPPGGRRPPPPEDEAGPGVALGGRTRTIRFPPFWHAWFARQTEPRLAALDELVDEHVERRALRRYLRRLKHATLLAFARRGGGRALVLGPDRVARRSGSPPCGHSGCWSWEGEMSLRWDRILDRLWLALSGGAAVTVALHGGAQLGLRGWPAGQRRPSRAGGCAGGIRPAARVRRRVPRGRRRRAR